MNATDQSTNEMKVERVFEANVIALHVVVAGLSLFAAWGRLRRVPIRHAARSDGTVA